MSVSNVVSAEIVLVSAVRPHAAVVDAAREPPQPAAFVRRTAFISSTSSARCRSAMMRKPAAAASFAWARRADAIDEADRAVRQARRGPRPGRARRSRAACRGRRRSWPGTCCGDRPIGDGDADVALDRRGRSAPAPRPAAPCSASVPARSRNASSIDSGSTSGVSASIVRAPRARRRRISPCPA